MTPSLPAKPKPEASTATARREFVGTVVLLALGAVLVAAGIYAYFDLAEMEASGEPRRLYRHYASLYRAVGKWGVAGIVAGVGAIPLLLGLWSLPRFRR